MIGPFGLNLISDFESVMHRTELGVVMILFLVGLEPKPPLLWRLRTPILGMGGSQVLPTVVAIGLIFSFLSWQQGLAILPLLATVTMQTDAHHVMATLLR